MITGYFGSCCCKTEQIFLIFCVVSMKATRSKRGYLVQCLIYISAFLFGWGLWEPRGFWFMGYLARCFFGFDSSGFTSPEFHFDFWVWTNPKKSKQAPDETANFHTVSTQNYKLCPFHNWKTALEEIHFPKEIFFKLREEDDPNSSVFSSLQGSNIQLTSSEIVFTREVVLRVGKNQSKGLSPLLASFLRKHEYVIPTSTLKFICTGHFSDGLSTQTFWT